MQIGIGSFVAIFPDPTTGVAVSPAMRIHNLLEEIELADQVGLDVFGIGEHHRRSRSGDPFSVQRRAPSLPDAFRALPFPAPPPPTSLDGV